MAAVGRLAGLSECGDEVIRIITLHSFKPVVRGLIASVRSGAFFSILLLKTAKLCKLGEAIQNGACYNLNNFDLI